MTVTAAPPDSAVGPETAPGGADAEIAANLVRLNHTLDRFKASVQAASIDGDWQLNHLLFRVLVHGPMRSSELAELVQMDQSTVSRQVATLVRQGLVERRADEGDGRAMVLHPTEQAAALHERHLVRRGTHYREMLADWSEDDQQQFATLLSRFTDSFEAYRHTILADLTGPSGPPREEN